jgi:hypothetical protein
MAENMNEKLNNRGNSQRNNSEDEALLKTEGKIKSLVFNEQPARESFRQELKSRILSGRQKSSMKFWQVKFIVPAAAFAFVLSFAAGAVYLKYTGTSGTIAQFGKERIAIVSNQAASAWQKLSGQRNGTSGELAVLDNVPAATIPPGAETAAKGTAAESANDKILAFNLIKPAFAEAPAARPEVKPVLSGEKAPVIELSNYKDFENKIGKFSVEQKKALEENNFFLAKNNYTGTQEEWGKSDDFIDVYGALKGSNMIFDRSQENAVFISSDLGLHLYHVLIDRSFQKLEETKLQPALREMSSVLFADSVKKYNQAADPVLKDSYRRLAAYYLIPLVVLDAGSKSSLKELNPGDFSTFAEFTEAQAKQQEDLAKGSLKFSLSGKKYAGQEFDDSIYNVVQEELKLMASAAGKAPSPLFSPLRPDFQNDYTQFVPRSHYTKNNILKSYFIAMMWYGRMGFTLKSPELTRDAVLITGQVNSLKLSDGSLAKKWADMADVIDFFVGESDDLTPRQYTREMKNLYGEGAAPETIIKDGNLDNFIAGVVKDLPSPRILSEIIDITGRDVSKEELLKETLQFRFMGQRFTPDAYVLNKLVQGDEAADPETGQKLPSMATALEPLSVIAPENQTVKKYFAEWVAESAPKSDKIIAKVFGQLAAEFSQFNPGVWTQNIYWSWLNSFRSLLGGYGQGYPFFMKSDAWQKKNLGTVLGSYTELKHDTLLYAKQSYAELGAGGPDEKKIPAVPKGYVEPDLVFWNKIGDLAEVTLAGLRNRDMFPEEFAYKFETFINDVKFFQEIAAKELQNQKISDDDFEKLRLISNSLAKVAEALPGEDLTTKEKRAGIVADIHTDGVEGKILYEATGKPNLIYTAVKDINGTRLTVGAVYSHYEFIAPLEKRLTDEDWQSKVYDGSAPLPAEDKWTSLIKK